MKRSEINKIIDYTIDKAEFFKIPLPPFAFYTLEDWKKVTADEAEIVDNMLGWDITDFGTSDFEHVGLTVFTFRNGNFNLKISILKIIVKNYYLLEMVRFYHFIFIGIKWKIL